MPVIDPQSLYQNALAAGRNFWSMAQNSPLGYAVQSTMPRLADALNLHPTATVYSPDYQASRNNLVNPQFLIPGPAAYHSKPLAFARGMASSASNFTSPQNLALMGGMAATGGLLDFLPFVPGVSRMVGLGMAGQAGARTLMNRPHLDPNDPATYEQAGQWFGDASQAALGLHMAMQPSGFWEAAGTQAHTTAPGEAGPRPITSGTFGTSADMTAGLGRAFPNHPAFNPAIDTRLSPADNVQLTNPRTPFAEWPENYRNAATPNFTNNGSGGANYTAADLAALKAQYGIADTPAPNANASALPAGSQKEFVPVSAQEYRAALDANPHAATLSDASTEDLENYQRFGLNIDGKPSGIYYSISPKGEISGAVNNGPYRGAALPNIMPHALQNGGSWLNAWDVNGTLPGMYSKYGFEPTRSVPYDAATYGEPSAALQAAWQKAGWQPGQPYPNVQYMAHQSAVINANHWSTVPDLNELDVNRFGTSTTSGQERARANEPGFIPRTYLADASGGYREPRVTNRPYQYNAKLNANDYYDIQNDPQGIWQQAFQQGGPTAAENAVKQAGYSGYRGHGVVASFDNVPVQSVPKTVQDVPRSKGFWGNVTGNERGSVRPDVLLAPFEWATKAAAKRFQSIVPPSVAEHLPQGWENILRTPTSQQNMLDTRAGLSSPAEVQAGAQFAQQRGYNWYEKSRMLPQVMSQVNPDLMPEERVPQFLNVGAATSARTRVPRNLAQTLESWNMLKDEGFPSEEEFVRGLFNNPRTLNPPDIDMKPAKVPNISRAMADQPLGGMKIFSFGGDLNFGHHGTVDTIEGVGLGMKQPEKASQPANYLAGRSILSQAADNLGTDIHQVQSSHWTGIQSTGLLKGNSSLRTADPADVIANMRKNLEAAPSMDFASVAIDALEGRHYTSDYARIDRALRQGFGNDETKINAFLTSLKGELEPLNRAAASAPLGQANSRQLRNFVRRVQQSSINRSEE